MSRRARSPLERAKSVQVSLIQVSYTLSGDPHGGSKGPERLVQAAVESLAAGGDAITVERIELGEPFLDAPSASVAVGRRLAPAVRRAITAGNLPVVAAPSCEVSPGILSGFDHSRCGIVWIDAHGDFNTPQSTITGFFPGMSLAIVLGHCHQDLWAQIGNSAPVGEAGALLLGVRDLDPAERERLEHSAVQVVEWREGRPQGDVGAALERLSRRVREVYLHIDMDSFDPQVAPGIVDPPVPGGLSLPDMEGIIRAAAARFRIRAAGLTTYNPDLDPDGRTLRAALRIIELLADS